MKPVIHNRRDFRPGFTLIEVVLAVGVFVFAIVAILGLFGSALQSSKQVGDEDEALGLARALPTYLQNQGFSTVYGWLATPPTPHILYGYYISPTNMQSGFGYGQTAQQAIFYSATDSALTQAASVKGATSYFTRLGRLFVVQLSLSPDMPIHATATGTNYASPSPNLAMWSATSSSISNLYPESVLPIRASFFDASNVPSSVSSTGSNPIPAAAIPVFTYDTTVSR